MTLNEKGISNYVLENGSDMIIIGKLVVLTKIRIPGLTFTVLMNVYCNHHHPRFKRILRKFYDTCKSLSVLQLLKCSSRTLSFRGLVVRIFIINTFLIQYEGYILLNIHSSQRSLLFRCWLLGKSSNTDLIARRDDYDYLQRL